MAAMVLHCPCGTTLRGANEDEIVARAQEHARTVHDREIKREEALAMARPE